MMSSPHPVIHAPIIQAHIVPHAARLWEHSWQDRSPSYVRLTVRLVFLQSGSLLCLSSGNKFSSCHACLLVAGVWCYAAVFAVGPLLGWGEYGPEPYGTACCIDWHVPSQNSLAMSYIVCLFFFCYIVPCTVIFLSYVFILLTVRGSRQAVQQHMSPQNKITNAHALIIKVRS